MDGVEISPSELEDYLQSQSIILTTASLTTAVMMMEGQQNNDLNGENAVDYWQWSRDIERLTIAVQRASSQPDAMIEHRSINSQYYPPLPRVGFGIPQTAAANCDSDCVVDNNTTVANRNNSQHLKVSSSMFTQQSPTFQTSQAPTSTPVHSFHQGQSFSLQSHVPIAPSPFLNPLPIATQIQMVPIPVPVPMPVYFAHPDSVYNNAAGAVPSLSKYNFPTTSLSLCNINDHVAYQFALQQWQLQLQQQLESQLQNQCGDERFIHQDGLPNSCDSPPLHRKRKQFTKDVVDTQQESILSSAVVPHRYPTEPPQTDRNALCLMNPSNVLSTVRAQADSSSGSVSSLSDSNFGSDDDDDSDEEGIEKTHISQLQKTTVTISKENVASALPYSAPIGTVVVPFTLSCMDVEKHYSKQRPPIGSPIATCSMIKHSFYEKVNRSYFHFINCQDADLMRNVIYQGCCDNPKDICSISRHWSRENPNKDARMNPFGTVNYKEFYGTDDVVNYFQVMFDNMPDIMAVVTSTTVTDITAEGESERQREHVRERKKLKSTSSSTSCSLGKFESVAMISPSGWQGRGGKKVVSRFYLQATAVVPVSTSYSRSVSLLSADPTVEVDDPKEMVFQSGGFSKAYSFKHPRSKAANSFALCTSMPTESISCSRSHSSSTLPSLTPTGSVAQSAIVSVPGRIEGYLITFFDSHDKFYRIEMHYFTSPPSTEKQ